MGKSWPRPLWLAPPPVAAPPPFQLLLTYLCCAVVMVCLLRYAQVIEHSRRCWVNTSALVSGCTNAVGLVMVGNFQVSRLEPRPFTGVWRVSLVEVTTRTAGWPAGPLCIAVKQE